MNNAVFVALISAIVAIVTSVAGIIANIVITKKNLKANKDLEVFKTIKDRVHVLFELSTKEIDSITILISDGCSRIQKCRDSVRDLLTHPEHLSGAEITAVQEDCSETRNFFAKNHAKIKSY